MPTSDICQNAKRSMEQIRPLKKAFDDSFASAVSSGDPDDVQLAQEHKQTFLKKMAEVRMQMHAWEKRFVQTHEQALLSSLSRKKETGGSLTKLELFVLYEIHTTQPLSPEMIDIRKTRNHDEDLSVMFDEFSREIARSVDEITPETRIYVGSLNEPDFFQKIPDSLEFIYTSLSERRIRRYDIKIGGKDEAELKALFERSEFKIYESVDSIMEHEDFKRSLREPDPKQPEWKKWQLKSREDAILIRLSVGDLGFPGGATTEEIYARAEELGLELCPPAVGPEFRLQYANQPMDECIYVGMKQIFDSDGDPNVFGLEGSRDVSWLSNYFLGPSDWTFASHQFVFRLRKQSHQSESDGGKPTM